MHACRQKLIETIGVIVSLRVAHRAALVILAARLRRARAQLFFSTGLSQLLVEFMSVVRSSPPTRIVGSARPFVYVHRQHPTLTCRVIKGVC